MALTGALNPRRKRKATVFLLTRGIVRRQLIQNHDSDNIILVPDELTQNLAVLTVD